MRNRGQIKTTSIADRMKKAQKTINNEEEKEYNSEEDPQKALIFINGRLNRKNNNYIAKNFSLLEGIANEINIYCKGIDLAIINTVIHIGLEKIKNDNKFTMIDYANIESKYITNKN